MVKHNGRHMVAGNRDCHLLLCNRLLLFVIDYFCVTSYSKFRATMLHGWYSGVLSEWCRKHRTYGDRKHNVLDTYDSIATAATLLLPLLLQCTSGN